MRHSCTAAVSWPGQTQKKKRCPVLQGVDWTFIEDVGYVWVCPRHAAKPTPTWFIDDELPLP